MFRKLRNNIPKFKNSILIATMVPILFSSCIGLDNNGSDIAPGTNEKELISNTPDSVSVGYGRILNENPIILTGDYQLSENVDLNTLLTSGQEEIVYAQQLIGHCNSLNFSVISNCYQVMEDEFSSPLVSITGKWAYNANSREFAQVQAFGHTKRMIDRYLDSFASYVPNVLTAYPSAIPTDALTNQYFWARDTNLNIQTLNVNALCDYADNASFDKATFSLCFGYDSFFNQVKMVHDSSVIYHELGHGLNHVISNIRNNQVGLNYRSSLGGNTFYDEGGSINEGIADYFSYYMTSRTHFGEWSLGRFQGASRPITEDDPAHIDGLDSSSEGRLSYPAYLNYWSSKTTQPFEDNHFNGQIISHYMVALTELIQTRCSVNQTLAQDIVIRILTETLTQLGDLTSKGHEKNLLQSNFVNLNSNHSFEWWRINNPINYHTFSQTWAKFTKYLLVDNTPSNICYSRGFTTDDVEFLLDDYGLLLFNTYNEDGNGFIDDLNTPPGNLGPRTKISLSSRLKTKLINKDFLITDPGLNKSDAFIFDKRSDMLSVLVALNLNGVLQNSISEEIPSDLIYNNGNGEVSPGEFVGILLNIYNNHTEAMAGIQILANDWDHFKDGKPCNNQGDNFPTFSEGAASLSTGEGTPGGCDYITRSNGDEAAEDIHPVCFVQINGENSTRWTTQADLIAKTNLDSKKCLGGENSTHDCFLRVIKGADTANLSKVDPKESWIKTLQDENGKPQFSISNLLFFEVSPWVPPGTKFNCRLRARFVNCADCYSDKDKDDDNFLDYQYSGGKPFKIINFSFTVID